MKDNFKAQNLKFYLTSYQEREKLYNRAKELGYDIYPIDPNYDIVYLREDGSCLYRIDTHSHLGEFAQSKAKQLTVKEFLAPQKGEMVEFSDDGKEWHEAEFFCDLGEDSPRGRYLDNEVDSWIKVRPLQKDQHDLPQKKGFDEAINHLEEVIKLLKG